jgi:hypothetical protein
VKIDIVYGDDWSGVFVDDESFTQDHSIRDDRWGDLLEIAWRRGKRNQDFEIAWWEVDYYWIQDQGRLPSLFNDIPKDKLERIR